MSDAVKGDHVKKTRKTRRQFMPQTDDVQRPVLTVKETADYLRVSESLIWKQVREGKLKPMRIGDRVLFTRSYLDRFTEPR
jgi:excisionase family DNA binding protein